MTRRPPGSTLFPYATLFRSGGWRVNLLCHGRARASFSLTLRAGAMRLERIGRQSGVEGEGGGLGGRRFIEKKTTNPSHQLARGGARLATLLRPLARWHFPQS